MLIETGSIPSIHHITGKEVTMFITFEGIEGSGKTTQVQRVADYLKDYGHHSVVTREPGGTKIGVKIREILLDRNHSTLDATAELMLYMADRAQHVKEVIEPALAEGKSVLCDRFLDATVAYQGYGRGLDILLIHAFHSIALGGILPDLTFLFDLPAEKGLARAWARIIKDSGVCDESRFEEEALSFHEKVRKGYLEMAKAQPARIRIIDATSTEDEVFRQVIGMLPESFLNEKEKRP